MPKLKEIKKLAEKISSQVLEQDTFVLYYNACLYDLSEVISFEKEMEEFTLSSNDIETELPDDLFQVVSVVVENSDGSSSKRIVDEVATNSDVALDGPSRLSSSDRRTDVYSRWNNKVKIYSIYLEGESSNKSLKVNIKYYGTLPVLDIDEESLDLEQYPPIKEQHYHVAIAYYIGYMYYLNQNMLEDAQKCENIYLLKKKEIKEYVYKHRKSSNMNDKVRKVRT